MADTEKSLYKYLELLQKGILKAIELILQTPLGKYIEFLISLDNNGAAITGGALGVLSFIVWKTNSEWVLLAIVATIVYIVYNAQKQKETTDSSQSNEKANVCPKCEREFDSYHGLKVHDGKKH